MRYSNLFPNSAFDGGAKLAGIGGQPQIDDEKLSRVSHEQKAPEPKSGLSTGINPAGAVGDRFDHFMFKLARNDLRRPQFGHFQFECLPILSVPDEILVEAVMISDIENHYTHWLVDESDQMFFAR
ncbi:MAG: hypothetical protein IPJ06_14030 [Saprospiraceae bacterium]|nr:hypothetical protein [Saprospiraceae bacterium]